MIVLGIETSCDETGLAVYDTDRGLLAHALHSQVAMHEAYGGVVPELASRDHIQRVVPLAQRVLAAAGVTLRDVDGIAHTQGPGLAGALLVGAAIANALGFALGKPVVGVHHLEGHLLSPLLAEPKPEFPFVALLVSGGHSQLFDVEGVGRYRLLGDTQDDAAGEAFDKTAKLLGLPYPGGPALAQLAESGREGAASLPRPMLDSGNLDMSFSGLKTAVLTLVRRREGNGPLAAADKADIAREFQHAVVDVLVAKALAALAVAGRDRLVVAGGVGANRELRARLAKAVARRGGEVFFPALEFCTDNGAMIALVGALRLANSDMGDYEFSVRPRWDLASLSAI
jgi:tRNA N6-adenosine threonylcarbamoyltransferase